MPSIDLSMFMSSSIPSSTLQVDGAECSAEPINEGDTGRAGTTIALSGTGFIQSDNAADFLAVIQALTTYAQSSGSDFTIKGDNSSTLYQILASQCLDGGPHVGFKILQAGNAPYYRRVTFTVHAATAALLVSSFKFKIATKVDGLKVFTQSGTVSGPGAQVYFGITILPGFLAAYPAGLWETSYSIDTPYAAVTIAKQLQCRYTLSATQLANALPFVLGFSIVQGEVSRRSERDDQQRKTLVYDYDLVFKGFGYQSIVDSLRSLLDANSVTHESSSYSSIKQQRLRCSFTVLASGSGDDLLTWNESIQIVNADDVYEVRSYPGADPIAVLRPTTLARVLQHGSATALGAYPEAPGPVLHTHEQQQEVTCDDLNNYEKRTTWSYKMIDLDDADPDISQWLAAIARPQNPPFYGGGSGGD
jgi:hypothetical protein